LLTLLALDSLGQKTLLQMRSVGLATTIYQQPLDWHLPGARFDCPALHRRVPAA